MFRDSNSRKIKNNCVYVAAASGAGSLYILSKAMVDAAYEIPQNLASSQLDRAIGNTAGIALSVPLVALFCYLERLSIEASYKRLSHDVKHFLGI